ncbi:uncharacterized protein LOC131234881 [Magnolia sinica]|uniref:uncharacterized protein LOC131234881 n=1 Tax=Magnolia sinica TaxID=86752 RepID=UPI002658593A|nr:uncharacterized protein LOC131234881 [Magnolia sinica]
MKRQLSFSLFFFSFTFLCLSLFFCHGIESPQFTVVRSESDFEIRLHGESSWMTAPVQTDSFETATKEGFHRLYIYIHGGNEDSYHLAMTAPVLTSIDPDAQSSSEYSVRLYLSTNINGGPPHPLPNLNLKFTKWGSRCVAVRKFSGFAKDDNIIKEAENLSVSLQRSNSTNPLILEDKHAYTIAQYNSSSHLVGRLNEVWMNVVGHANKAC